ncbi:MAG: S8/S53 family peptidase [Ginsengibacter sp.]
MPIKLIVKFDQPIDTVTSKGVRSSSIVPSQTNETIGIVDVAINGEKEWDEAHKYLNKEDNVSFAEPDIDSTLSFFSPEALEAQRKITEIKYDTFINDWPAPDKPEVWHIADNFSGLKAAREEIHGLEDKKKIRIVHLDTGYDEEHLSYPKELINLKLSRSFVEGEDLYNAEDRFSDGMLSNPGHGTGTLSLLAGNKMKIAGCIDFEDYVGLEEAIEIVPIRIAKSVVLFKSAAFVEAMNYIINDLNSNEETKVHVITMSMGGLASRAWADVVNKAYDQGIFMVTAAGNNFLKLPTNRLIFPARFNRVVAACGVTYDLSPYVKPLGHGGLHLMEGNHGPRSLMKTALAAFTPNVPWAIWKQKSLFGIRGDGTSSATPQIAAAAALYYSKYYKDLEKLSEPYMIVEAIRYALFESASKSISGKKMDYRDYFGNGILNARKALNMEVPDEKVLKERKQKKDSVFLPFIRLIFGFKKFGSPEDEKEQIQDDMLETELMQLSLSDPEIQKLLDKPDSDSITWMNKEQQKELALLVMKNLKASNALKEKMQEVLQFIE